MFAFIPFQAFVPPVIMVPVREEWTSTLDVRTSRGARQGKRMALGNGHYHHDFISFSFENDNNPPDETLVVMHPVTARHYIDLQTEKLKALFEVLSDLQETRAWAMGLGIREMPARQRTIDVLADVIRARNDGLGHGKKSGEEDGEPGE